MRLTGVSTMLNPKKGNGLLDIILVIVILGMIFYLNVAGLEVSDTMKQLVQIVMGAVLGYRLRDNEDAR